MHDSIFTQIIKGEIPCHKVYEDDYAYAFMDIHPVQPGMVVVASKHQTEDFLVLREVEFEGLMKAVWKISHRMKEVFPDKKRIAVVIEGLEVNHTHVKLIPINTPEELRSIPVPADPDHVALGVLARRLAL